MKALVITALLLACASQPAPRVPAATTPTVPAGRATGALVQAHSVAYKMAATAFTLCEGCVMLSGILGPDGKPLPDGSDVWVTFDKKAAYRYQSQGGSILVRAPDGSICIGSTEKIAIDGSNCFAWATVTVGN